MCRVFQIVMEKGPSALRLILERVSYHIGLIFLTLTLGPYIMR